MRPVSSKDTHTHLFFRFTFFFFIVLLLCLVCFCKIQHHTIYTIPQSRRGWAIFKYVTQMRFTATTLHLSTLHAVCVVGGYK